MWTPYSLFWDYVGTIFTWFWDYMNSLYLILGQRGHCIFYFGKNLTPFIWIWDKLDIIFLILAQSGYHILDFLITWTRYIWFLDNLDTLLYFMTTWISKNCFWDNMLTFSSFWGNLDSWYWILGQHGYVLLNFGTTRLYFPAIWPIISFFGTKLILDQDYFV